MAEEIKKEENKKEKSVKPPENKVKLGDRIKKFFKDYKSEMKKVVWPTKDQLIKNTGVVLVAIIFMAVIVGVLDLIFGLGISLLANVKGLFT